VTPGGQDQRTSLYLVDPLGGRYRVATMPAPASYELADWSGDGRRALVLAPKGGTKYEVEDVYLGTGKVLHHFLASTTNPVTYQFTRPDGLAVLAELQPSTQSGSDELMRLTLSGAKELTYPTTYPGVGVLALGGVLESLDGTELVVEASKGMALVANDGKFIRDIGPAEMCTPERWWTTAAFVASCDTPLNASFLPALWLVHTNGQPSSQLTHPSGHDSGDVNGWQIGSTVYTQALGPCGTEFLARRAADGHMVPVDVPGTNSDVQVVGTEGSRLALRALLGCGGGNSLFWFNPATAKETPLLGPPVNGGDVLGVLAYPGLEN
jgi:TolB protein